ncbi:RteC domain-containing protein [Aquimarina longa]|uniref:RteC domain-containing protein n=1 Tax=Aquimarina longa TaxID=1080221 RepID=UPI000783ED79|nr:RteC domain-containing protein [Aquimarina longa]
MNPLFATTLNEIWKKEEQIQEVLNISPIKTAKEMALFTQSQLEKVKEYVLSYGFETVDDEITFFKEVKPQIQGMLLYYKYIYHIETSCPIGCRDNIIIHYRKFYKELSERNQQKYCKNSFYQYFKSGRTDKDEVFFTQQKNKDIVFKNYDSFNFIDTKFTTFYDCLLSLIYSEEKLLHFIERKEGKVYSVEAQSENLQWLASKSSLVELIYALYSSQSVKGVSIRSIASSFEELFRIKLGDIHHTYHRMKSRSNSRTLFLDRLKISLEHQLQVSDA